MHIHGYMQYRAAKLAQLTVHTVRSHARRLLASRRVTASATLVLSTITLRWPLRCCPPWASTTLARRGHAHAPCNRWDPSSLALCVRWMCSTVHAHMHSNAHVLCNRWVLLSIKTYMHNDPVQSACASVPSHPIQPHPVTQTLQSNTGVPAGEPGGAGGPSAP